MKGYTIQHSIELLEKQAGSGSGGASTASEVSFDNTDTGLVATNVQNAITEVNSKVHTYSANETVVGKWIDNSPVYEKVVDFGAFPNNTTKTVAHGIESLGIVVSLTCVGMTSSGQFIMIPLTSTGGATNQISLGGDGTNLSMSTGVDRSGFSGYAIIRYTKTPAQSTKSKKKSKEE